MTTAPEVAPQRRFPILAYPSFVRLWIADVFSGFGMFSINLGMQFLMIDHLGADQADIGIMRSLQWLPTLLFGLLAGVWLDRIRRRPVLIGADTLAAVTLGTIAALALADVLTVGVLGGLIFILGTATVFALAAQQSYLPSLVPVRVLPRAYSRIDQTMTTADALGPLLAGFLIRAFSAPVALAVSGATYAVSAILVLTIGRGEKSPASPGETASPGEPSPSSEPSPSGTRRLLTDFREGASWVYRHRTLAPYAVGLHLWFLGHSVVTTVYVFYANQDLGLNAFWVGLTVAFAGITGVIGAGVAPRLGERFGVGRICVIADWITPLAYLGVLLAPVGTWGVVVLCGTYAVHGVGMGMKGPLESSYRNGITPDRLRGRMNSTIRTFNWGMLAITGPVAGYMAVAWGNQAAIAVGIAVLVVAACVVTLSPFRRAQMSEADGGDGDGDGDSDSDGGGDDDDEGVDAPHADVTDGRAG